MPAPQWSLAEAEAATSSVDLHRTVGFPVGVPAVVFAVEPGDAPERWAVVARRLRHLPVVSVATGNDSTDENHANETHADATHGDLDALIAAIVRRPHAATVTAGVLRHLPDEPLAAFQLESLAYATLQAGPEHARWLARRGRRVRNDPGPRVRLDDGDPVSITLTRGRLHNLLDRYGRDELADAFRTVALLGPDVRVRWDAEGPSFCAGGDPAEFGTVADAATAHLVRASASPALALATIAHRVEVHVHGACVGAGIELAAQAAHVVAHPSARFRLPELTMGLIPGVGGTWSIGRRIGRQRLLTWLLLDDEIGVETALSWGLVDAVSS